MNHLIKLMSKIGKDNLQGLFTLVSVRNLDFNVIDRSPSRFIPDGKL